MNFNLFKSIIASRKQPVALHAPSASFFVSAKRVTPYIEPRFSKLEFDVEKPPILLVSAVGASGKTTTAHALSFDTQLPVLDLAKHKPVADNTLTGILTSAYAIEDVGTVLAGLRSGEHGIIIDGIDEARSKTTEQGFEAFLDDLIERSKGAPCTTIVVLGRSQVLLSTWCYLVDQGSEVGLVQIDPFDIDQARTYIDAWALGGEDTQAEAYQKTRDSVLSKLSAAFSPTTSREEHEFLSFIGYPPVLDAIAALLQRERNYHRIEQALSDGTGSQVEVHLLIRIADYLLDRDHDEKALPNFIEAIAADVGGVEGDSLRTSLYDREEQCARALARALGRPFPHQVIADSALNERYEEAVAIWCPDHPFLSDAKLRNAVFAAMAIAHCALSSIREYRELARDYAGAMRPTYHLLYLMGEMSSGQPISVQCFNMLMQSCSEFLGINAAVSCDVDGESWEDSENGPDGTAELTITIELSQDGQERTFTFDGRMDADVITFGPYLVNSHVTLPGQVELVGSPAIEAMGECRICARGVRVDANELNIRGIPRLQRETTAAADLVVVAQRVEGHVREVSLGGGKLEIQCLDHGLDYPLARHVRKIPTPIAEPELKEKYRRLRRILSEFRSHKKGALAKYRDKIEHERVLRNDMGRRLLETLCREGILRRETRFYFIDSGQCDAKLGISWHQLQDYESSEKLEAFLRGVS